MASKGTSLNQVEAGKNSEVDGESRRPPASYVNPVLEWCFIISIDTRWDWFQRAYVVTTARKNL